MHTLCVHVRCAGCGLAVFTFCVAINIMWKLLRELPIYQPSLKQFFLNYFQRIHTQFTPIGLLFKIVGKYSTMMSSKMKHPSMDKYFNTAVTLSTNL